jgi:N-acetylglutamate synthase-like GNAT family acetyltransferase
MELQLRKMTIEDVHDVQRLSEQLGYSLSEVQIETNIKEVAASQNHAAFVAIYDQKIVGWVYAFRALLIESKPFIEIGGLVVDENYRNKGIGKTLVEKIKEWASKKAINELRVRSNILRNEAYKFYLTNGFNEIKQQKVFQMHL